MTPEELAHLQAMFGAQLARRDVALDTLSPWLSNERATAHRFARYQASLRHHHLRSLMLIYPVLHALVGAAYFRTLAHAYGDAHVSRDGDLRRFGAQLPSFVAHWPSSAAYPYFGDVARLEWALHEANYALDAAALGVNDLAAAEIDDALAWRPALQPAATLHASAWRVAAIWLAHRRPECHTLPAAIDEPSRTLVYRDGWTPALRELDASEWAALSALSHGASLGDALAAGIAQQASDTSRAPFDAAAVLRRWLGDGLLVRPCPR